MMSLVSVFDVPIGRVHASGLAVLKIVYHCLGSDSHVTGQLLGSNVGDTVQVTDCFPLPAGDDALTINNEENEVFQLDMMRCLHEINIDNNSVGWYQSTLGTYQTADILETFSSYQTTLRNCICFINDPQVARCGGMPIKAIKVNSVFMTMFRAVQQAQEKLRPDKLHAWNHSWNDIFQDIPIEVHNSTLLGATTRSLQASRIFNESENIFDAEVKPILDKTLSSLIEAMDDLMLEQQRVNLYFRHFQKWQQLLFNWQQRRQAENAARMAVGEELLTEDAPSMNGSISVPNPLDRLLLSNQIAMLCSLVSTISIHALQKGKLLRSVV